MYALPRTALLLLFMLTPVSIGAWAENGWGSRTHRGANVGLWLRADDLHVLKSWGADHVRAQLLKLPLTDDNRGTDFAASAWRVIERFLADADEAGLQVVLDQHMHDDFFPGPEWKPESVAVWQDPRRISRFVSFWQSVARRLRGDARVLAFDLLNEPHPPRTRAGYQAWNAVFHRAVAAIRREDPDRWLIVECADFANPGGMARLEPVKDDHVVYSFHMYMPHEFTEQGTRPQWPFGQRYPGVVGLGWDEKKPTFINRYWLERAVEPVVDFQRRAQAPIWVGEFSARRDAPDGSGYRYLRDVLDLFDERGWSWAYHAFREARVWDVEHCARKDCQRRHPTTDRLELLRSHYRGQSPLTWRRLFGIHYSLQEESVGTVRGAPLHQWGPALDITDGEHEQATAVRGPFSGVTRYLDFNGRHQRRHLDNDAIVTEAGRKDIDILAPQGLKLGPKLKEETPIWQDVVYAQVLRYNTGAFASTPLRYWQVGNEINGIGHFNILGIDATGERRWAFFNRPEQRVAYVNRFYAPTVAAIRKASADAYGDPDRLRIVVGSVANAYNPKSREWLDDLLGTRIDNPHTPALTGKFVWQTSDMFSFHYLVTRAADDWESSLDELHGRWVASGKMKGMWATEEHGAKGRGFVTVVRVAARWLHWWSRHPFHRDSGRCILWGPDRAKPGGRGMEAVTLLGQFLGDWPLQEVTGRVHLRADVPGTHYAFRAVADDGKQRLVVIAFPHGGESVTVSGVDFGSVLSAAHGDLVIAHADRPRETLTVSTEMNGRVTTATRLSDRTEDTLLLLLRETAPVK